MISVIIAAGGKGSRAGVRKQFVRVRGKSILEITMRRFLGIEGIGEMVIALPYEDMEEGRRIVGLFKDEAIRIGLVAGGETRQESVASALSMVSPSSEIILIHDAVRPFVKKELIERIIRLAREKGAVIPGITPEDTIKRVDENDRVIDTLNRDSLIAVQTPQGFRAEILRDAYEKAFQKGIKGNDDSALVEMAGYDVWRTDGDENNIKITYKKDLKLVELLYDEGWIQRVPTLKIGEGFDFHKLIEGRKLIIGGVEIPFDRGLEGHSDADVLTHAIMNALLGASGEGDIGVHFSPDDERWKGVSSIELLKMVIETVRKKGGTIINVDSTIIAEKPRMRPYILQMKKVLSSVLRIPEDSINIKAVTTEGLSSIGRGEGIAATSTVLIREDPV